ncbi:unnamed protein product [Leptosia nina]|uniref:Uncharacterized protein n=1 Tax=Leptosia nina TaxID=320188 RepID=A0AAV1IZ91_9NEOP
MDDRIIINNEIEDITVSNFYLSSPEESGDININIAPNNTSDNNAEEYLNLLASHAMLPAYFHPTRKNNCIDHVMLRTLQKATTIIFDSQFTDHAPVLCCIPTLKKIDKNSHISTIKRIDLPAVVDALEKTDLSLVLNISDPETAAFKIVSIITSILDKFTVIKRTPSKHRIIKPWITPGLLRCIRHRDKLYRTLRKDPTNDANRTIYIRYRNHCNRLLKKVKIVYERSEFEKVRNDSRAAWKFIRQKANMNNKKSSSSQLLEGLDDHDQSVNAVNDYFSNIGKDLASKLLISTPYPPILTNQNIVSNTLHPSNSMVLLPIESEEIHTIISNMKENCAVGWDGIPSALLKSCRHILVPVLTHIFNLSIDTGVFPKAFKVALCKDAQNRVILGIGRSTPSNGIEACQAKANMSYKRL